MSRTKRLIATLAAAGLVVAGAGRVQCQGVVSFVNGVHMLVSTNSVGMGGAAAETSPNPNGFYYGLFLAPSTVTSLSALDLLTPTWTFTGIYATNAAGPGILYGGTAIQVPGWVEETNSFVVAGWSANVGLQWSSVAAQLAGASLNNGVWSGTNWIASSKDGFFGVSSVGFGAPPSPNLGQPPFPLISGTPYWRGTPISSGWNLFVVNIPEPSSVGFSSLVLLASASRLAGRRR